MVNNKQPHALVIPWPLQGHLIPTVHFAIKLASNGFTITFINTESIHEQLCKALPNSATGAGDDVFAAARKSGLDIRYLTISDGFPVEFERHLNLGEFMETFKRVFPSNIDELVGEIVRTSESPVNCLISDTFHWWPSKIAEKYNLVNVSFWTEPALAFSLYYHLDLLTSHGHIASNDNRTDTIDYIPGVQSIQPTDLISHLRDTDTSTVLHQMIFEAFESVRRSDFIVCNTVQELETETISAINQNQTIYAIGPIFPSGFTKSIVATSLWFESDCTHWLNTKPHGSVLYVSFGSLANVSEHDILEIAHGLLLSGVNFVWVLRRNIILSVENYSLPVGFEDDVKDRGLIVPWCTQIEVISHPSIGGFLTHCGWNSVLESVWCSVPMICFPLRSDQFTNRKLVVENWRIGINLCDGKSITSVEVAEKINHLMSGKLGDELRDEMIKVKRTLEKALNTEDGSADKNFKQFIKELKIKASEKC